MKKVLFILVFGLMSAKNDTFQNAYNSAKGNSIDINIEDYNIPPLSYLESYALMKEKQSKFAALVGCIGFSAIGIMGLSENADGGFDEFAQEFALVAGLIGGTVNYYWYIKKTRHTNIAKLFDKIHNINDYNLKQRVAYLTLLSLSNKAEINISKFSILGGPFFMFAYHNSRKKEQIKYSKKYLNNFYNQVPIKD